MRTSAAMDAARSRSRDASSGGVELEPATVLPVQLFGELAPDASVVPEKRLLLAVLEEAVVTFQRYVTDSGRRGRRLFREAEEWVGSDELRLAVQLPQHLRLPGARSGRTCGRASSAGVTSSARIPDSTSRTAIRSAA